MKTLLKNRLFVINVSLAFLFAYASILSAQSLSLSGDKLIKPSTIEMENETFAQEGSHGMPSSLQQQSSLKQHPDFIKNLQANIGSINLPMASSTNVNGANTWVPKFVWLGDIQKDDELKCFAAFLIGSLADQTNSSSTISPGVFMTPVTTSSNATTSSIQVPVAEVEKQTLVSRSSSNTPPPPTPIQSRMFTELEVGLGFLYFSNLKGTLNLRPYTFQGQPLEIKRSLEYNRSPLFTFDFGWRLADWLSLAVTMQSQQNVHIRTKPTEMLVDTDTGTDLIWTNFQSYVDFNSIGGKLLFTWPNMIKFNGWGMSLFIGGSCAGGWQSWTEVQSNINYLTDNTDDTIFPYSENLSFRDKYFGNFTYTGDAGLLFKPTNIFAKMGIRLGCKILSWGATRGLGAYKDQKDITRLAPNEELTGVATIYPHYFKPIRIGTIYSWAPYVGINWDF